MLTRKFQIACKIEATEGVAETLAAADVFFAFNPRFTPRIDPNRRQPLSANLSPRPSIMGRRQATFGFDVELVGGGAAGDPVPFSAALKACGVAETLVADTSATYQPASAGEPSVTLGWYLDGKQYLMWGARGTARIDLEAGRPGVVHFEFTGADWSESDTPLLPGVSYYTTVPPVFMGATFTIDSYAAVINSLSLDLANTVTLRPDIGAPSGYVSAFITDRSPTVTFDPENVLAATHDFLGKWRSGALMALSASLGSEAGNTIAITAPKLQYQTITLDEREGISVLQNQGLCCGDAGDDEWQIQIT